jgi:hypothetical protein
LGLGTLATQDATSVAITGGAINGTTVGATTASTGKFTNLEATGTLKGSNGIMAIGTSQIYKDATGNVGFNSIVPSEKIDVVGNIKASGTISAATQFTGPGTGLTGTAASLSIGGNAANVTGTVAIANGGTGQITANAAFNALAPSQTSQSGKYLTTDGTNTSWATNPLGTVTSVSFTGGLISVATSTTTPAFTVAGTSRGIPYFSSASTWASTAAGTTGQVLTATTGGAPTWAAPATSGTVTSVAVSGGTTGLTTSGGPITSSGTITLAGTVATTNGGTGLTSFTANGVVYASSSSALATGSALTFDGTNFATTGTATATKLIPTGTSVTGNGMYLPATNSIGISTAGTNAVYIDASQNVGIGTSSPSSYGKFSVYGASVNGTATFLHPGNASYGTVVTLETYAGTDSPALSFKNYNSGSPVYYSISENSSGALLFNSSGGVSSAGTERMRIASTGIVTMSAYGAGAATFSAAGVISSVSDETWKIKDGIPVDPDAMLKKLEPGYWYYNDEKKEIFGKDRQLGFYAQNVNAAIGPEAAPEPEEGKPWGYYDRSVLAVAVMSLQKALDTIDSLTARIAALEQK